MTKAAFSAAIGAAGWWSVPWWAIRRKVLVPFLGRVLAEGPGAARISQAIGQH